ncbi:MAG: hypothetical protein QF578_16965 [Alphaproteobacteria bacterium]|jgi:hypothetical protein|nr:hypothetical protein [Alphaproteobacteria bacterium]MDP6566523.1 hypothetical protein [Alphaproteobacteria bacterium]MDP6812803.1 hypothetical protein [Alphaproteobacteria bacterium]
MAGFAELAEADAAGDIAVIYAEIRLFYAAPYVSSLQRHFATHPGLLEWAWGLLRPGFASGLIPETAWRLAGEAAEEPLPQLDRSALRVFGVDAEGEGTIRAVCRNFERVAPLNLLFAGCLRHLLAGGAPPAGPGETVGQWQPPAALPPLPAMVDVDALPADQAAVLGRFATPIAGRAFVPGLYRMLAHWPDYLARIADDLGPRLADPGFRERGEELAGTIVGAVPEVLARLPAPPDLPGPEPTIVPALLDAIASYRRSSPEMVLVGGLLRRALPPEP